MGNFVFADPKDVIEDDNDGGGNESPRPDHVDGLGVLRAVVGAWQSLLVADGAANSGQND